jgi:hypothetical protein
MSDGAHSLLQSDQDNGTAVPSPSPTLQRSDAGLLFFCQVFVARGMETLLSSA